MLYEQDLIAGRYRLERRLASGGMSDVWVADDVVLARQVALKVVAPRGATEPGFGQRFQAEARTLAALHHPGIVDVYDFGRARVGDDEISYLAMALVDGEPLTERLAAEGRLSPAMTMSILAKTADALQAAHDAGVVHHDVKPANLMLATDGSIVLVDFGIASVTSMPKAPRGGEDTPTPQTGDGDVLGIDAETPGGATEPSSQAAVAPSASGSADQGPAETADSDAEQANTAGQTVMGTALYMAPEQATGMPVSPSTDLYSLGVVGYHCLTGRPPFLGDNAVRVAAQHVHDIAPPLPQDLPPAARAVVERAMAKDPARRYPNAAAMAAAARAAGHPTTEQLAAIAAMGLPGDTAAQPALQGSGVVATASVEDRIRSKTHRRYGVIAGAIVAMVSGALLFAASPAGDQLPFIQVPPTEGPAPIESPSARVEQPAGVTGSATPLPSGTASPVASPTGPSPVPSPAPSSQPSSEPSPTPSPDPPSQEPEPSPTVNSASTATPSP